MNVAMLTIGVLKVAFALAVGGGGIVVAYRVLARWLKLGDVLENPAAGVLHASTLVALAVLMRNSLGATYDTIDLLLRQNPTMTSLARLTFHSAVHLGVGLLASTILIALSLFVFDRLTPGIDEVAAVREGKLGPALLLGAIVISLAVLVAPGLEALLSGLVPFPSLPVGTGVAPS